MCAHLREIAQVMPARVPELLQVEAPARVRRRYRQIEQVHMLRRLRNLSVMAAIVLLTAFGTKAEAVPLLQLDIAGGVYDPVTQTIVAPGGQFTVYAILTPKNNATAAEITALLSKQYFVSAALSPQLAPPGSSLGSFTIGTQGGPQNVVNVTSGMTYGVPPLETMSSLQGMDPGDLAQHGVFPTYFYQQGFYFSPLNTAVTYNTATNPGGPTPSATGTSYYAAITGNSTFLSNLYRLHFDLYNEAVYNCATKKDPAACTDVDVDSFAPFSHDAEVTEVPEPCVAAMMLAGLGLGIRRVRRG